MLDAVADAEAECWETQHSLAHTPVTKDRPWGQCSAQCWGPASGSSEGIRPAAEPPPLGHRAQCLLLLHRERCEGRGISTLGRFDFEAAFWGRVVALYCLGQECCSLGGLGLCRLLQGTRWWKCGLDRKGVLDELAAGLLGRKGLDVASLSSSFRDVREGQDGRTAWRWGGGEPRYGPSQ